MVSGYIFFPRTSMSRRGNLYYPIPAPLGAGNLYHSFSSCRDIPAGAEGMVPFYIQYTYTTDFKKKIVTFVTIGGRGGVGDAHLSHLEKSSEIL